MVEPEFLQVPQGELCGGAQVYGDRLQGRMGPGLAKLFLRSGRQCLLECDEHFGAINKPDLGGAEVEGFVVRRISDPEFYVCLHSAGPLESFEN